MNFPYNLINEFGVEKSIDFFGGLLWGPLIERQILR